MVLYCYGVISVQLYLKFLEKSDRKNEQIYIYNLMCKKDHTVIQAHWHDEFELLYTEVDGEAELDGVKIKFEKNDIIFVNKQQLHRLNSFSDGNIYAIVFNYEILDFKINDFCQNRIINNLKDQRLMFQHILNKDATIYKEIKNLLSETILLYYSETYGKELKIKANLYNLIFLFFTNNLFINSFSAKNDKTLQVAYVKEAITFIENTYHLNVCIADISEHANISTFYLIKIFKEITGTTPIVYLNELRLKISTEFLKDGLSVTQTAYNTGFNNLSYFIRIFKKKYGISPHKFKNLSL